MTEPVVDVEDWVAEAKAEREAKWQNHRLVAGPALREELRRARAAGRAIRHADRLRRLAARTREDS